MTPFVFDSHAQWIWLSTSDRPYNTYACFRRRFTLQRPPATPATLTITADSRYDLYINGHFVGHGPVRSWPSPWPVDQYDVTHLLRGGDNVIAVLVHHFGISTFQYLHDQPGLVAQLACDDHTIVTDPTWRCVPHAGYHWPVPRISCQQGWEEQLDARIAPGLPDQWSGSDFNDSSWPPAIALRPAGQAPHEEFELRPIPFLTRKIIEPLSICAIEAVYPAQYSFTLNPRDYINPDDKSANHIRARILLATYIHSDRDQKIDLHPPHERPRIEWKLNGKSLDFNDHTLQPTGTGVAHAKLKQGPNLLIAKLPQLEHFTWATINLWTEDPVRFATDAANSKTPTAWLCLGPFAGAPTHGFDNILVEPRHIEESATADRYAQIWTAGQLTEADVSAPFTRPLTPDMVVTSDAYATSASERVVADVQPAVENPTALLADNGDWTTIHNSQYTLHTRLLLDFGDETVAQHEFELDAPAAAILDVHNFEFIQRDGRKNLCEGMNNSFRYVCREGVQRYRTFIRRGFRYSWLSFRNFDRPIRIRFVRAIQSTYPIGPAGFFECSDHKLNRIWNVGVHSVRCCAEDTYTDCPTYEQTLWVGDARNEALVHLISDGDPRLSEHCIRLTGRSLQRSPITESQVPSGWQNLLPTWTFLWMRWAHEHFMLTGDTDFGNESLSYLERNNQGIADHLNERNLFEMKAWNLFDWAPMDTPGRGIVTHINCLAVQGLRESATLAKSVGRPDFARTWTRLADRIAAAVNKHLWSNRKKAYLDCIRPDGTPSPVFSQQTATAAYISGVATGPRARRCLAIIDKPPKGFVTAGSPFFMFFLLEALVREKRFNQLVETIRNYWGQQIDAGATTFWEMYHPGAERLTRSHCHGWSAAPVVFLTRNVLGIEPAAPGYTKIRVAPNPANLAFAQGRVPTPLGPIDCYWATSSGGFELKITTPAGSRLQIQPPYRARPKILAGRLSAATDGTLTSRSTHVHLLFPHRPRRRAK